MSARVYRILILIIVAMGAFALLWPRFVIDTYGEIAGLIDHQISNNITANSSITNVLGTINFDPATTTNDTATTTTSIIVDTKTQTSRLVIPSIKVDWVIVEGTTQDALMHGFWHIPGSALPGQGSNVVLSGHRWLYKPPSTKTFYNIDKIKNGDLIYYDLGAKRYTYRVEKTEIVDPSDVKILEQNEDKLTIFTCHPLFSTKKRFVVTAKIQDVSDRPIAP